MRLLIDGDGCPVVDIAVRFSRQLGLDCLIFCDTAHNIHREGAFTFVVSQGRDSVDFAIANALEPGDLVITQDYGLAALCLSRRAQAINQDGLVFTAHNIDALLLSRHTAAKVRRSGGRLRGAKKRAPAQDDAFAQQLLALLAQDEKQEDTR